MNDAIEVFTKLKETLAVSVKFLNPFSDFDFIDYIILLKDEKYDLNQIKNFYDPHKILQIHTLRLKYMI
jgi:hypothetical protein